MTSKQPSLFAVDAPPVEFHGSNYVEERDRPRLGKQFRAVYNVMSDGGWWTAEKVHKALSVLYPKMGWPVQSIDRQMRYLKDIPSCTVEKESRGKGLWVYRLVREE